VDQPVPKKFQEKKGLVRRGKSHTAIITRQGEKRRVRRKLDEKKTPERGETASRRGHPHPGANPAEVKSARKKQNPTGKET